MAAMRILVLSAALVVGVAGPVGAQTTTTMPPVRSIPVTPAPTTTAVSPPTTAAPAARPGAAAPETAAAPLADTGLAADKFVPLGFLLIGLGAVLTGASRRYGRPTYRFL